MSSKTKFILALSVLALLTSVVLLVVKGYIPLEPESRAQITDPVLLEGKRLSEIYCSTCHKYPDPGLLPWRTWRFETLGAMAPFLGIDDPNSAGQNRDPRSNPYLPDNIYPDEPQVTQQEWQKIRDYFLFAAPREWSPAKREPVITVDSLYFKARFPAYRSDRPPSVTAVKFDPANRLIYLGDSNSRQFFVFNYDLDPVYRSGIDSPISDFHFLSDESDPGKRNFLVTFIGRLDPSDAPYGSVVLGRYDPGTNTSRMDSVLSDGIARPVNSSLEDLNQDGMDDLLVNEFGHRAGKLFWIDNIGNGDRSEKNVLVNTPGCIQSHVMDYTGNGRSDILALCTQTAQAIYLFENEGSGEFGRMTLLTFEVTAGSSSFEVHDFNNDSYPDILYTSGDNADFSQVLKPYHGVYIYLNDGRDHFTREWFYPINGAYNAKARDFNGNGRLDIAVISYFADYENHPEEGFLFFENEGGLSFTPYHHPAASQGRWLTMDVADWTGNGRDDIILANFPEGPLRVADNVQEHWMEGPHFMLLENQSGR